MQERDLFLQLLPHRADHENICIYIDNNKLSILQLISLRLITVKKKTCTVAFGVLCSTASDLVLCPTAFVEIRQQLCLVFFDSIHELWFSSLDIGFQMDVARNFRCFSTYSIQSCCIYFKFAGLSCPSVHLPCKVALYIIPDVHD